MNNDQYPTQKDLDEDRRKHFQVEVKPCYNQSSVAGEIRLSITTNGNQWQSISLTPEERLKVIRALINAD